MAHMNPAQAAEKWNLRLKGATEEIKRGVEAVQNSPMDAAANKAAKYLQGVQDSVAKWQANLRAVSLPEWKNAMLVKGLQRLGLGADAAKPKVQAFYEKLFPFQESLQSQISTMADVTFEDSVQRMIAWSRGMREFTR